MAKYRKTALVEAVQWLKPGDHPAVDKPVWSHEGGCKCKTCGQHIDGHGRIDTLEGNFTVCPGDWILTGVQGEHWPVKDDIFRATYEAA